MGAPFGDFQGTWLFKQRGECNLDRKQIPPIICMFCPWLILAADLSNLAVESERSGTVSASCILALSVPRWCCDPTARAFNARRDVLGKDTRYPPSGTR